MSDTPAPARPAIARIAWGLAFAGATLVVLWLLSQAVVATWLERDALQRAAWWQHDATPWQWQFGDGHAISWPGSEHAQLIEDAGDGVRLRVDAPTAALPLRMRGERIDPSLPVAVQVDAEASAPMRVLLLAERAGQFELWATIDLPASGPQRLPLADLGEARVDGLLLHVETAQPAELTLRSIAFLPAQVLAPAVCEAFDAVETTLARCDARLARFTAPPAATTDRMLWWRDALLAHRPAAVVTAGLGGLSLAAWLPREAIGWLPHAFVLAGALSLLAALWLRRRASAGTRPRAALELALLLAVPVALLAAGWPGDNLPTTILVVFLLALATAVALPDPTPGWQFVGDARARRAAAVFTLLAGGALLALGLWLADADTARSLDPERFWRYPLWAALQQWLLMRGIAPRTRRVTGSDALGALLAGALFALLHLPNFGLMVATFVGGSVWAWFGYRYRALLPLIVSHALLGLMLVGNLPPWLLRSAEVGGRYLMAP